MTAAVAELLLVLCCVPWIHAQETNVHVLPNIAAEGGTNPASGAAPVSKPFRANVDLVLVPVTVVDPDDRVVTGLTKENFSVYDDKRKEEIRTFSVEDAPISLGIIFDTSRSMTDKIDNAREAVAQFLQTSNPEDEFFLIGFSDQPRLLNPFTGAEGEIQNKLIYIVPQGPTALIDAIYLGMTEMRNAYHRRKALLIISDGGDNHSRYTDAEIKRRVKEADVQLYAIGIFDTVPRTIEEQMGPTLLSELTETTGGRTITVANAGELPGVANEIGNELRSEYVLGYRPSHPAKDGKWHKIKVKLSTPKGQRPLSLYAKRGYYASE